MIEETAQNTRSLRRSDIRNVQIQRVFRLITSKLLTAKGARKYTLDYVYSVLAREFHISEDTAARIISTQELAVALPYRECCYFYRALFDAEGNTKTNAPILLEAYFSEVDQD